MSISSTLGLVFFLLCKSSHAWFWSSNEICCDEVGGACFNDDYPFDHLPLPPWCFNTYFEFFSRTQTTAAAISPGNIPATFDSNLNTIFIVHGFQILENGIEQWQRDAKDALLQQGDYNVILTTWTEGADTINGARYAFVWNYYYYYTEAASNTRIAGKAIELLRNDLTANQYVPRETISCVGLSLGAHVCGYAGENVAFGRITGLDPANPEFSGADPNARLDSSDADFVDIVHTNGGAAGIKEPIGHADFYPNAAALQPGCEFDPVDILETFFGCSHGRVIYLYIESIQTTGCFTSAQCSDYNNMPGTCESCGSQVMGLDAENHSRRGVFYLTTNENSPYCRNDFPTSC